MDVNFDVTSKKEVELGHMTLLYFFLFLHMVSMHGVTPTCPVFLPLYIIVNCEKQQAKYRAK